MCSGCCSSRLWCGTEVDEAHDQPDVVIRSAMSDEYIHEMVRRVKLFFGKGFSREEEVLEAAGVVVHTIQAKCGNPADEAMLIESIKAKDGGFTRLDKVVQDFRLKELPDEIICLLQQMREKNVKEDKVAEQLARLGVEDFDVQMNAMTALDKLPVETLLEVAPQLVARLQDKDWSPTYILEQGQFDVRHAVVRALLKLPGEALVEVAPQLVAKLEDSDSYMRQGVVKLLGKLPVAMQRKY